MFLKKKLKEEKGIVGLMSAVGKIGPSPQLGRLTYWTTGIERYLSSSFLRKVIISISFFLYLSLSFNFFFYYYFFYKQRN